MTGEYHVVRSFTYYAIPDRSVVKVITLRMNLEGHAARNETREMLTKS